MKNDENEVFIKPVKAQNPQQQNPYAPFLVCVKGPNSTMLLRFHGSLIVWFEKSSNLSLIGTKYEKNFKVFLIFE